VLSDWQSLSDGELSARLAQHGGPPPGNWSGTIEDLVSQRDQDWAIQILDEWFRSWESHP
jgi:hypothetical protein